MTTTPVLSLPDFSKPFVLETDACAIGIGAVLMQEGGPIALFSKPLGPRAMSLSTYEKELMAVGSTVTKWIHYLQGRHFTIKTDHESIKYFLEQKITTGIQKKWLMKLLDRDKVLTSNFWQDLFKNLGTSLKLSTAYHPQTDGQTERLNACLENYFRCMTSHQPKNLMSWLDLAEWWYNTSYHTSLKISPFKSLYGYEAPHLAFPPSTITSVDSVEKYLKQRENLTYSQGSFN
ncbi:uncharacterized protein LOC113315791 [Papaver somniferum]|uniref:uncharacterized protein LOC113315791 n=1 Tax=Papaver somniferum TaxID=3469 RepID=UPI000E700ACC|nr:uncharacterized protein LOC113315791 [Papaver somniferum]